MDQDDARLSRIDTLWSVVRKAHDGAGQSLAVAQQRLIEVYGGAIHRYLLGALRDEDAAQEVFQEFALNLVRGVFQRADPQQGRFRNLVKTALFHLIVDYQRRQRRRYQEKSLQSETPDIHDQPGALADQDEAFTRSWRDQLLARCWEALADTERTTGKPYHAVLRFRLDHPEMHSPELAEGLSAELGKPLTAGAVRVVIHRAREMFADRLMDAVMDSLDEPSLDEAEQELIELGLLDYCRTALARRREAPAAKPLAG